MTAPADAAPVPPLVEPRHDWDDDAKQAGRADRDYWADRDWPTEPDDPSDHYNY